MSLLASPPSHLGLNAPIFTNCSKLGKGQSTGQRQETEIGLDYYVARFYDPVIAHFVQADSIVPTAGSTRGFDRYAYVMNNPVRFLDPTGNKVCDNPFGCSGQDNQKVNSLFTPRRSNNPVTISELLFDSTPNSGSKDSINVTNIQSYVIGNSDPGVNYYGDYPNDPIIQTKNPLALATATLDWISRFKTLLPQEQKAPNFFIFYQFTVQPEKRLEIERLIIENYYDDSWVFLRSVRIKNGSNDYLVMNEDLKMESGFGSGYEVYELPIALDPNVPTSIEIRVICDGCMNSGNGPFAYTYIFTVDIPKYDGRIQ